MSSLSWFIYASDVIPSVGILAGFLAIFGTIGVVASAGIMTVERVWPKYRGTWSKCAAAVVICCLISVLTPSKSTMYAIAAAEIGQKLVDRPDVQGIAGDATKALQQWIKKQIDPEPKK